DKIARLELAEQVPALGDQGNHPVSEYATPTQCLKRVFQIEANLLENLLLLVCGREQAFYVFHHKDRRLMHRNDSQVFLVEKMFFVCCKLGVVLSPRATDDRVSLARGSADQDPVSAAPKRGA